MKNLRHLAGMTRRSLQQFARHYYAGANRHERERIFADWENLRRQAGPEMTAIKNYILMRDIDGLLDFIGLSESELKDFL